MRKVSARLAILASALFGVGAAATLLAVLDGSEPQAPRVGIVEQDSVADAGQIRIHLTEAIFSGNDTTVLALVTGDGKPLTDVRITAATLAESDFVPGTVVSIGATAHGEVILRLPPILRTGALSFTVEQLSRGPGGVLEGPWKLTLHGPPPDDFDEAMRVEELRGATVGIADRDVTISARRTSTRTIVSYTLPGQLLELSGPTIIDDRGEPQLPLFRSSAGLMQVVEFPPTTFGNSLKVELGAYAVEVDRSTVVSFSFQALARRNGLQPPPGGASIRETSMAAVESMDILDGSAQLLRRAGYGFDMQGPTRRDVVHVVVAGNWDLKADENTGLATSPLVVDGSGRKVQLAGVNSAFSKNSGGDIGPGETTISLVLSDSVDLSQLTISLDGPLQVVGGHPSVVLSP